MIIKDLGEGVFHAERDSCGNRYLNDLHDKTGLVTILGQFRKDNPSLRIVEIIPMLDTRDGNKNYDYYLITEPKDNSVHKACSCICLTHGEVDAC